MSDRKNRKIEDQKPFSANLGEAFLTFVAG